MLDTMKYDSIRSRPPIEACCQAHCRRRGGSSGASATVGAPSSGLINTNMISEVRHSQDHNAPSDSDGDDAVMMVAKVFFFTSEEK